MVRLAAAAAAVLGALPPPAAANAVPSTRNPKKGVSFSGAQSCPALEPHTDSSWWYTWSTHNGFDVGSRHGFCDSSDPGIDPVGDARSDGMDFVPNFWSSVPALADLDAESVANLLAATVVMTFNEPERSDQANLTPAEAAAMWANLVDIANEYGLEIVAPCMVKDAFAWFDEWETECVNLYGTGGCRYDYTCIHIYQQPHPCDTTKNWECVGDETGYHAKNYLDRWHDSYGKPVWVTEYGCYPWADPPGCTARQHQDILDQLTAIFESPDYSHVVDRYAWFTTYASGDDSFGPGSLNALNWEALPDEHRCSNMEWINNVYGGNHCEWPPCLWGAKNIGECVAVADGNADCHRPLTMTWDNDNCYCATDACETPVSSHGGTKSWKESSLLGRDGAALTEVGEAYNAFGKSGAQSPTPHPTTKSPTKSPTASPTESPTRSPTAPPPTKSPTKSPTQSPTASPTKSPTQSPTAPPPTKTPTKSPTQSPTASPTKTPTQNPTAPPPTKTPTKSPTQSPTKSPTAPEIEPRYICSRNPPSLADACAAESDCTADQASAQSACGNGNKVCRRFDCAVAAPTSPVASSPPANAPVAAPTGDCLNYNEGDCSVVGKVCCPGLNCRGNGACK